MELIYYFYTHLEDTFEKEMVEIFNKKDYDAFMKIYETEKNIRLPEEAVLYIGENTYIEVPIDNKDVFMSVMNIDYQCG